MPAPITFVCEDALPIPPEEIAAQMLDMAKWPEFDGYGVLPGIKAAEFELRTPEIVGSQIRVTNRDGSSHLEEIVAWNLPDRLQLSMHGFSPPLSRLASRFDEIWEFCCTDGATQVVRTMHLHPKSAFTRPALWLIAKLLKRAIARHLRQMRSGG